MTAAYYQGNKTFSLGKSEQRILKADEVRLEVAYCGICGTDIHIFHGNMDNRVQIPQVIGHEVSAVIAEIGSGVNGFKIGDKVTVRPLAPGTESPEDNGVTHIGKNLKFIGIDTPGGMQTSWIVPAYTLHHLPEDMHLHLAALIEPLSVACHDVRLGKVQQGETVVVLGGGPIGLLIALIAREKGARVIVSEVNSSRLGLIQSLGFETINPFETDLAEKVKALTDEAMADIVFEVTGTAFGAETMTSLLKVRGRNVMVAIYAQSQQVDLFRFFWKGLQMVGARVY